jgi:hypothetical protein
VEESQEKAQHYAITPGWYYPDELARKAMRRENRFGEKDLKRQERTLDERDAIKGKGSSKGFTDPRETDGIGGKHNCAKAVASVIDDI